MSDQWYARPVLFVADIDRSIDFYVKQLGFTEAWRYEEEAKAYVAQVERKGCELILSSQWPDKAGNGLIFISLDVGVLNTLRADLPIPWINGSKDNTDSSSKSDDSKSTQ